MSGYIGLQWMAVILLLVAGVPVYVAVGHTQAKSTQDSFYLKIKYLAWANTILLFSIACSVFLLTVK